MRYDKRSFRYSELTCHFEIYNESDDRKHSDRCEHICAAASSRRRWRRSSSVIPASGRRPSVPWRFMPAFTSSSRRLMPAVPAAPRRRRISVSSSVSSGRRSRGCSARTLSSTSVVSAFTHFSPPFLTLYRIFSVLQGCSLLSPHEVFQYQGISFLP